MVLKQLLFFKKLQKIAQRLGASPQTPFNNMFELQYTSLLNTSLNLDISHFNYWFKPSPLNEFLVTCQHQPTASDLSFYDIFAPTKKFFFEVSDDAIACDL